MDRRRFAVSLMMVAFAATPALAQRDRRPTTGGGGGPDVPVFRILAIDTSARTLQLQAADGSVSKVVVPDGVYDLTKLKVGDRVQVNIYVPDAMNPDARAAAIWPVQ